MNVDVTARGPVAEDDVDTARRELSELERFTKGPILGARAVLTIEQNPRLERPARAEGEVNLAGRPIRGRVEAPSMAIAVDELAELLKDRLVRHVDRLVTQQRKPAG